MGFEDIPKVGKGNGFHFLVLRRSIEALRETFQTAFLVSFSYIFRFHRITHSVGFFFSLLCNSLISNSGFLFFSLFA